MLSIVNEVDSLIFPAFVMYAIQTCIFPTLGIRLHVTNLAPNALVSSSKEFMDPSSKPFNHLMAIRSRL